VKRHPLDVFSLVSGVFLGLLGLTFLLTRVDVDRLHLTWIWPVPLIAMGVLIIALAARSNGNRDTDDSR
jgi:hypothetical protein